MALRRDGSIACWGENYEGEAPPAGVDGNFVAIAADGHSLALRHDGHIVCWHGFDEDDEDFDLDDYGQAPTQEDEVARLNSTPFMTEVHIL